MKVKELINKLKELDGELKVILSKDSEGNSYSPLWNCIEGFYFPTTSYSGETYFEEDYEDDPELKEGEKAIVFFPTN